MLAQAYSDGLLRVFDVDGSVICSMRFTPSLKKSAEDQLKRLRLRRRGPWKDFNWGSEAKLRFDR